MTKASVFKLFPLLFCFFALNTFAADDVRDSSTGEVFPSQVSFDHDGKQYQLDATGVATRKKFFVKVYSVASYLQSGADKGGSDKFQTIMQDDVAKQLTLKWVHDAGQDKVQEGYLESFKSSMGSQYVQLQNDLNQFLQFFNAPVKKGDEHILRWVPGGYVEVIINGKKAGSVTNKDFAKGLWNIWFGDKSVVDRNNLVSLMKE